MAVVAVAGTAPGIAQEPAAADMSMPHTLAVVQLSLLQVAAILDTMLSEVHRDLPTHIIIHLLVLMLEPADTKVALDQLVE
jgi:hypothetical protein